MSSPIVTLCFVRVKSSTAGSVGSEGIPSGVERLVSRQNDYFETSEKLLFLVGQTFLFVIFDSNLTNSDGQECPSHHCN